MKIQILTAYEAEQSGLLHSRLVSRGHGAFGEPDNTYENVAYIGDKTERVSDNDFILVSGESPNREVIQLISLWNASDKVLELLNPKALTRRKEVKLDKFITLKEEIESDKFYKDKLKKKK